MRARRKGPVSIAGAQNDVNVRVQLRVQVWVLVEKCLLLLGCVLLRLIRKATVRASSVFVDVQCSFVTLRMAS